MRNRGFTLIELMIVVAIVAILSLIALPSYTESVRKGRRAQAKADLTELAQGLERRYTVDRTYATYTLGFTNSPRDPGANVAYTITLDTPTAKQYTLTATATALQANDRCGDLTLDQSGVKHHGGSGDDNTCGWGTPP